MSGYNLHGKQALKFYLEKITLSKVNLIEKHLILGEKDSDLDEIIKNGLENYQIDAPIKCNFLNFNISTSFNQKTFL